MKRGLFRLWLIVSLFWVALWAYSEFSDGLPRDHDYGFALWPPTILLIVGRLFVWAVAE